MKWNPTTVTTRPDQEKPVAPRATAEPKRKISAVWTSAEASQGASQDCTKCSSRSSSH